jgi:hypothetical protein
MSLVLTLSSALLLQIGESPPTIPALPAADSIPSHRIAARQLSERTVVEFLDLWRGAWLASAAARDDGFTQAEMRKLFVVSPTGEPGTSLDSALATRMVAVHCHRDGSYDGDRQAFLRDAHSVQIIGTDQSRHAICPLWRQPGETEAGDESTDIDAALTPVWRRQITVQRRQLLVILDSLAQVAPDDDFIVGQRVRFTLPLADSLRTATAVTECRGTAWWCSALAAFAASSSGHELRADSLYDAAERLMPPDVQCKWHDVGALLSPTSRREYAALPCARRRIVAERFWWLADPLHGTVGNSRRAIHRDRLMLVLLHSALPEDERYHWRAESGGAALREVIVRYGWPSFAWWPGVETDSGHSGYLRSIGAVPTRPYASFEYDRDRIHLVPGWKTIGDPFTASSNDLAARVPPADPYATWWPSEHVRLSGTLCELAEYQVALLRRQRTVRVAVAAPLRCAGEPTDVVLPMHVALALSTGANDIAIVAGANARMNDTVAVAGETVPRPVVLSLEAVGGSTPASRRAMRTRLGLVLPDALSAMRPGTIALSAPLLFNGASGAAHAGAIDVPQNADSVIPRMLGSSRLGSLRRLGVYWETYNVADGDSLEVHIRVERATEPDAWGRLASAIGIVAEQRPLEVSWRESPAVTNLDRASHIVPIRARSVVLDVTPLEPGDYRVQVEVGRPGGPRTSSQRGFSIP